MLKTYSCPKCGAKLKKIDTECKYCGSSICFDEETSSLVLFERKNYNTEKNDDFDYNYHYKQKSKKGKIIKLSIVLSVFAILIVAGVVVFTKIL